MKRVWLAAWLLLCSASAFAMPSFEVVRAAWQPSEAWLLDRNGELLQSFRADPKVRRLEWVKLEDLSPAMQEALIAAEDKHFFEHRGVDWQAFAGAALDNLERALKGQRARGASTITMQLAGMLDPSLQTSRGGRTMARKWDQIQAARELEQSWSKAQILEAYFNLAQFRGELAGIAGAARGLFGKDPSGLDGQEAAILTALLRSPAAPASTVGARACNVARSVAPAASCEAVRALAQTVLSGQYRTISDAGLAPHLRRLAGAAGSRVVTTLDRDIQQFAHEAVRQQLAELQGRNVADGAVVVIDNATGDVIAYVGSAGDSTFGGVDGVDAPRQAGSTLKPFLYALAIENGLLTAASILDDSPLALTTEAGLYIPQNYDKDFKGTVSLRTALASSLNVPAVRTLMLVGFEPFRDRLRALGLETITQAGAYYGYALALGAPEVTLLQLTNAYRALANGGRWSSVRFRAADPPARFRSVGDARADYIVADILADRAARAVTFDLDNPLATRFWTAVKTGTSKDMRDNWCVGFSDRYTVGVWVGNADGSPMHDVSGITGAAPVWRALMHRLHGGSPGRAIPVPAGLVRRSSQSAGDEWFIEGSESDSVPARLATRIAYPATGTVIALDPDIPAQRQRVLLRASQPVAGLVWKVDDQALPGDRWEPAPGRHRLELWSPDQRKLDEVAVEVRGAMVAKSVPD